MAHAVKSRRSRILGGSGLRLPRSAAMIGETLPVTNQTPIPQYPAIATVKNIDGLLGVRR